MSYHGMYLDLIARVEREVDLAAFERKRRLGLLEPERRGAGVRAWAASRLLGLALRLDRGTGERLAQSLTPRHA